MRKSKISAVARSRSIYIKATSYFTSRHAVNFSTGTLIISNYLDATVDSEQRKTDCQSYLFVPSPRDG